MATNTSVSTKMTVQRSGTFTFANGNKYVCEFKDYKRNGRGIAYRADGTIERAGQWADGKFVQSFALDRSRFPFNPPT
jgi:hypothetical protein